MKEERRTETQKDIFVVVILSGVTLDEFQPFGLHQEGFLRSGVEVR